MNSIIKPGVVLLIVCVVASAILGYVNAITAEPIAKADAETKNEKKIEAFDTEWGEEVEVNDENTCVTGYTPSKDGKAYAIATTSNGFSSGLKLMFAVSDEGKILGMSVVDCSNETPGLGANAGSDESFREQYKDKEGGLAVEKDGGDIVAITGATITSRAVTNAANAAVDYYNNVIKKDSSLSDNKEVPDDKDMLDDKDIPDDKGMLDDKEVPDDKGMLDDKEVPDDKGMLDDKEVSNDKETSDDKEIPDDEEISNDEKSSDDKGGADK